MSEAGICERFRQAREAAGIKQNIAAAALDISVPRLKTYEYGVATIPFVVAELACRSWNINQRWLATGRLPMHPHFDIEVPLLRILEAHCEGRRISFGMVYDKILSSPFDAAFKAVKDETGWPLIGVRNLGPDTLKPNMPPVGSGGYSARHFGAANLGRLVQGAADRLPARVFSVFESSVKKLVVDTLEKYRPEIEADTADLIPQMSKEWIAWEKLVNDQLGKPRR